MEENIHGLTVSVGQQLHQAVQTRVSHLPDVGGAAADGLDGCRHKVFVHAFNVSLPEKKTLTQSIFFLKKRTVAGDSSFASRRILISGIERE